MTATGAQAWLAVSTSPHYAYLRDADVETVERAFLPPEEYLDVDRAMSRPVSAVRKQWRAEYLAAKEHGAPFPRVPG